MMRFALLAFLLLSPPAHASEQVRVTTDDAAYCQTLHRRVLTLPAPVPEQALNLAHAGRTLCDQGHARTGIAKLRRALRVAHGDPR